MSMIFIAIVFIFVINIFCSHENKEYKLALTLRWFTAGVQSASLYDNFRKPGNYVTMTSLMMS